MRTRLIGCTEEHETGTKKYMAGKGKERKKKARRKERKYKKKVEEEKENGKKV